MRRGAARLARLDLRLSVGSQFGEIKTMGERAPVTMDNEQDGAAFARLLPADATRGARRSHHAVEASEAERAAVARSLGLIALSRLRFEAALAPDGREGWRLEGALDAEGAQACVATLEPVAFAVAEPVLRLWSERAPGDNPLADMAFDSDAGDHLEAEEVEPLPEPIDLGAVAVEALSLALDPFPRAADAPERAEAWAGPPEAGVVDASQVKPFAGLAALRAQMSADRPTASEAAPDDDAGPSSDDHDR